MECGVHKFDSITNMLKKMAKNSHLMNKHAACIINAHIDSFAFGVNKYYKVKMNNDTVNLAIHAEVDAISSISSKYLKGLDIIVIRVNKNNGMKNSRPCNSCIDKMKQKGLRKVYYSNSQGDIVYEYVETMPKLHDSSGHRMRN